MARVRVRGRPGDGGLRRLLDLAQREPPRQQRLQGIDRTRVALGLVHDVAELHLLRGRGRVRVRARVRVGVRVRGRVGVRGRVRVRVRVRARFGVRVRLGLGIRLG